MIERFIRFCSVTPLFFSVEPDQLSPHILQFLLINISWPEAGVNVPREIDEKNINLIINLISAIL